MEPKGLLALKLTDQNGQITGYKTVLCLSMARPQYMFPILSSKYKIESQIQYLLHFGNILKLGKQIRHNSNSSDVTKFSCKRDDVNFGAHAAVEYATYSDVLNAAQKANCRYVYFFERKNKPNYWSYVDLEDVLDSYYAENLKY